MNPITDLTDATKKVFSFKNIIILIMTGLIIFLLWKVFTKQKIYLTDEDGGLYTGEITSKLSFPTVKKQSDDEIES